MEEKIELNDSLRIVDMTFPKRTSSSSSLSSGSTHSWIDTPDDYLIRIPEPISDGTTVHDLSNSYAAMIQDNHSPSEVQKFFQKQTIILVPAPQPKFRINWTAVWITLVACVLGGLIGWGIGYFKHRHTSIRSRGTGLVNIPPINMEPILKKISALNINEPALREMSKATEEVEKLRKELPDIVKSSDRLMPNVDEQLRFKNRILEEEEKAKNRLKDEAKSLFEYIRQMPPQNANCTSKINCKPKIFFTRLSPINLNNTTVLAKLSN